MRPVEQGVKRVMDATLASAGLLCSAPLILAVSVMIRASMGKPVLIQQNRVGKDEKILRLLKFRTMTNERDAAGKLLPDAERLTRLGLFLRKTSLDELPQLINVLKGEMSLVGPRPLLVRYLPRYTPRQRRRHIVKPGITGWAQVHGRNVIDWDTRLEMDAWYAENASLWMDCKILLQTVDVILRGKGMIATAGTHLEEFWGTQGVPEHGPRAFPVEDNEVTRETRS